MAEMEAEVARVSVSAEQLGLAAGQESDGHLEFDLGNLMAADLSAVEVRPPGEAREADLAAAATQATQALVARLFQLPGRLVGMGRVVELPPPSYPLPRQKPLPTPRPPTRWEKFAQQKGIQKRKRSARVWDEDAQEWRRRFGYKRAGDDKDVEIVEASANDQPGEDPFAKMRQERKQRARAGEGRQLANLKHALKHGGRGAVPNTLQLAAALPEHGKGQPAKRKGLRDNIAAASRQAGVSTASMGKFDKRLEGEKPGERQLGLKRRKFEPLIGDLGAERAKAAGAVDRILRERAEDVVDMQTAVGSVKRRVAREPDAEPAPGRGGGRGRARGGKAGGRGAGKQAGRAKGSRVGKPGRGAGGRVGKPGRGAGGGKARRGGRGR